MSHKSKKVKTVEAEGLSADDHEDEIMNPVYKPPVYMRVFLYSVAVGSVLTLAYQMMLVWGKTPEWVVGVSVLSGLLIGVVLTYILSINLFRKLTQNMRFLPVLIFSFCLVAAVITTKRLIGL